MSLRFWPLLCAGLLCAPVMAEVPRPQPCEQLYVAMDPVVLGAAGLAADALLSQLERDSKLHLIPSGSANAQDFADGLLDLWLGLEKQSANPQQARWLQPELWQEQLLLWVRSGELTDLQHWPQLSGLRGGYWAAQQQQELLQHLQPMVALDDLRQQSDAAAAVRALLDGEIDYFMDYAGPADSLLQQSHAQGVLEPLQQPLISRSYHLAISRNSACLDAQVQKQLEKALHKRVKTTRRN